MIRQQKNNKDASSNLPDPARKSPRIKFKAFSQSLSVVIVKMAEGRGPVYRGTLGIVTSLVVTRVEISAPVGTGI